jgi:polyisoprenoid-binding protein YceI
MNQTIRHAALAFAIAALSLATIEIATADDGKGKDPKSSSSAVHQYDLDKAHSSVGFRVVHLGIANVDGVFHEHETTIELDPADLTTLSATTVIDVTSVDTGNNRRDDDLRSENFFEVATFPELTFTSTKVTDISDDGTFKLHGDLTIRDVTKPIVLDAEFRGPVAAMGKERIAFSAGGELNRFDYGLTWNKAIETGGLIVDEMVKLVIEVEANRALTESSN